MGKRFSIRMAYQEYADLIRHTHTLDLVKAERILNELRSGLIRGPLMTWDFERTTFGRKMTQMEVQSALEFMDGLPIQKLFKAREAMERAFDKQNLPATSRRTYGSRVMQFLQWAEQQDWWPSERKLRLQKEAQPPLLRRGGSHTDLPLTHRKGRYLTYQLQDSEISPKLQAELDLLKQYLSQQQFPGRFSKAIKPKSVTAYLREVRLALGYLFRYRLVPLDQLSLESLIPVITRKQLKELDEDERDDLWLKTQSYIEQWLLSYFQFLREEMSAVRPSTKLNKLSVYTTLTRFLYSVHSGGLEPTLVLKLLTQYRQPIKDEGKTWRKTKRRVAKIELKWPDPVPGKTALVVVQESIVEPVRLATRPRLAKGSLRTAFVIAQALLCFIKWALLVYIPARRQEDHRSLKIALTCPLQRPADVPSDGVWFPKLPDHERERNADGRVADNFIYRTHTYENKFYPDGVWILEIGDYKTEDTYGNFSTKLPNLKYDDGTCFYDYLDRYFCGQWLPGNSNSAEFYDWWDDAFHDKRGQWVTKGRSEFNPYDFCNLPDKRKLSTIWCWGHAFVVPRKGVAMDGSAYGRSFRCTSYQLIERCITPHMMRYMWATWAFQMGLSEVQLRSLAYAMGHSVETLRSLYEQVTPDERLHPIEEVLNLFWFNSLELDNTGQVSSGKLQQIMRAVKDLAPMEQRMLMQFLQDAS